MDKKALIFLISILVLITACSKADPDLKNYPSFLTQRDNFEGLIIVGDEATPHEVIAASNIAKSLNFPTRIVLCSEVFSIDNTYTLMVGNACTNACISEMLYRPKNCKAGLQAGKGRIDIVERGSGGYLTVMGLNSLDILDAARVLAKYQDYKLEGKSMQVFRVDFKPVVTAAEPLNLDEISTSEGVIQTV